LQGWAENVTGAGLRIGTVPYLNGRPLTAWFESPDCDVDANVVSETPSVLAKMLREGELDVALVSSIEAFRDPQALVVPGISISADGPVRSVRIFSRTPLAGIGSLATDRGSLTSVALAQILLKEIHGATVNCHPMAPEPETMLARCDAALLIGDRALMGVGTPFEMDLGEAWREHTRSPFVFAVWMLHDRAHAERAQGALTKARDWGVGRAVEIADAWSRRTGMPDDLAREYLTDVMQYDLDETKREALVLFSERCKRHGLLDDGASMRYACAVSET